MEKRYIIANKTTDDIIEGKQYELIEVESIGAYIIDETGKETYYHKSDFDIITHPVCNKCDGKGWFFVNEWFGNIQGRQDCNCQQIPK